jgi:hypothetical protein
MARLACRYGDMTQSRLTCPVIRSGERATCGTARLGREPTTYRLICAHDSDAAYSHLTRITVLARSRAAKEFDVTQVRFGRTRSLRRSLRCVLVSRARSRRRRARGNTQSMLRHRSRAHRPCQPRRSWLGPIAVARSMRPPISRADIAAAKWPSSLSNTAIHPALHASTPRTSPSPIVCLVTSQR